MFNFIWQLCWYWFGIITLKTARDVRETITFYGRDVWSTELGGRKYLQNTFTERKKTKKIWSLYCPSSHPNTHGLPYKNLFKLSNCLFCQHQGDVALPISTVPQKVCSSFNWCWLERHCTRERPPSEAEPHLQGKM